MIIPEQSKLASWNLVERMKFVPSLGRLAREVDRAKNAVLSPWSSTESWRQKNGNFGLFTTVWRYNKLIASPLASLYFDLDSPQGPSYARDDLHRLLEYLTWTIPQQDVRVYFSGGKGFHVEVEALTLGINPSPDLPRFYRFLAEEVARAQGITTFDYVVYEPRRMWRLENSQHEKSGLFKVPLSMDNLDDFDASEPRYLDYPTPVFHAGANEWLRDWQEQYEQRRRKQLEVQRKKFEETGGDIKLITDDRYVRAVIQNCIKELHQAGQGSGNNTLFKVAVKFFEYVCVGTLPEEYVTELLTEEAKNIPHRIDPLSDHEIQATLASAYRAAKKNHHY